MVESTCSQYLAVSHSHVPPAQLPSKPRYLFADAGRVSSGHVDECDVVTYQHYLVKRPTVGLHFYLRYLNGIWDSFSIG